MWWRRADPIMRVTSRLRCASPGARRLARPPPRSAPPRPAPRRRCWNGSVPRLLPAMANSQKRPSTAEPSPAMRERDLAARCGYVALVGAPNAGKSTLLNMLIGTKLAIVTPKVQTTRARLLGIAIAGNTQLILVDTPGIFAPRRRLDRAMVAAAWAGAEDADIVVVLVDASRGLDDDTRVIFDRLKSAK